MRCRQVHAAQRYTNAGYRRYRSAALEDNGTVHMPAAELEIDETLVAELLRQQHPDLTGSLRLVANGWDNAIFRLGDDLCVRLPRRQVAVELTVHEQRWMPVVAELVRVPVPVPVRVGVPSDTYPWPWTVNAWLPGRAAVEVPAAQRGAFAVDLAGFMADLHQPAPPDAPRSPVRGVPLTDRAPAVEQRLDSGLIPHSGQLRPLWTELVATPRWEGPPLWIHGDPHPANFLVDEAGRLAAVIDFGDVNAGDPATDLAAGWMVFDAEARDVFHAELVRRDAVDEATWARAKGWALNIGTALAAASADNPAMASVAAHTIAEVLR